MAIRADHRISSPYLDQRKNGGGSPVARVLLVLLLVALVLVAAVLWLGDDLRQDGTPRNDRPAVVTEPLTLPRQPEPFTTQSDPDAPPGAPRPDAISPDAATPATPQRIDEFVFVRLAQANRMLEEGRTEEAAALFEELIAEEPRLPEAYNNLAVVRAGQGLLEEAGELLEKALHTDARFLTIHRNLGSIHEAMARESYARGLRLEDVEQEPRLEVLAAALGEPKTADQAVEEPILPAATTMDEEPLVMAEAEESAADESALSVVEEEMDEESALAATEEEVAEDPVPAVAERPLPHGSAETEIERALTGWADAWSRQDVDAYIAYYAGDYSPDGMTRRTWESQRRERLTEPEWIRVELEEIDVRMRSPEEAVVRLRQGYAASGYEDVTIKRMVLSRRDGNWLIVAEANIEILR